MGGVIDGPIEHVVEGFEGDHREGEQTDPTVGERDEEIFVVDGALSADAREVLAPAPGAALLRYRKVILKEFGSILGVFLLRRRGWAIGAGVGLQAGVGSGASDGEKDADENCGS